MLLLRNVDHFFSGNGFCDLNLLLNGYLISPGFLFAVFNFAILFYNREIREKTHEIKYQRYLKIFL